MFLYYLNLESIIFIKSAKLVKTVLSSETCATCQRSLSSLLKYYLIESSKGEEI